MRLYARLTWQVPEPVAFADELAGRLGIAVEPEGAGAGTPLVASTHDGADNVTLRTGSPIADVATVAPNRSAVHSAPVIDLTGFAVGVDTT